MALIKILWMLARYGYAGTQEKLDDELAALREEAQHLRAMRNKRRRP